MFDRILVTLHSTNPLQRIIHFIYGNLLFSLPSQLRRRLFASPQHLCPICGSALHHFLSLYRPYHAWCPVCQSLQRHRLVWLFLQRKTDFWSMRPRKMLHIAPEPALTAKFMNIQWLEYVSGDLDDARAMLRVDISDMQFSDRTFDVVYCSHVLEHVQDDRRSMKEIRRVLKPGGWALVLVPLMGEFTLENPMVTDPMERERLFGQYDHLRRYGMDIRERLEKAGFCVQVFTTEEIVSPDEVQRFGLEVGETMFLCYKH